MNNIIISDRIVNVEYENRNDNLNSTNLVFKNNSFMMWKGLQNFDTFNTVFYINIHRSTNGLLRNKDTNGIWLWFVNDKNQTKFSDKFFFDVNDTIENEENYIYGIDNKFEGVGIKFSELTLDFILNDKKTEIKKSDFNNMYSKLGYKYIFHQCDIPSINKLSLRITFLNNFIYIEYLNLATSEYEFCFMQSFNFKDVSFLISGGLKNEKIIYTFDNISYATIDQINYEIYEEKSQEDIKINKILQTKLEIINNLGKETYEKTNSFKILFDSFFNSDNYSNYLKQLDKTKFDIEILNEILNENKVSFNMGNVYNNTILQINDKNSNLNEKLFDLVDNIKNLTYEKSEYFQNDPRENLIKSLDDLRMRQASMNVSIIEMYKSTLFSLEEIRHKAEEMETYKIFQQILFVLIFINALILFSMYKNIQESEEKEKESHNNQKNRDMNIV